jgi:transposase
MNTEPAPAGISVEDWGSTPVAVRALVLTLLSSVAQLQQRVAELEERLNQNSRNSSKPPSADAPNAPARLQRSASGRKAGGQPGHARHSRALNPFEQVQQLVQLRPTSCRVCGTLLLGDDPQPQCHQVTELPRVEPQVTEYRRHCVSCLVCGAQTAAKWPSDMPAGDFGPRLQASTAYLTGRMGLSQRDAAEALETLYHIDIGLGSIPSLEQAVSTALTQPVNEAQTYVQQQPVTNVDETGWRQQSKQAWLSLAAAPLVAVFLVLHTRGACGLCQLLGETFQGIVTSDRWSAYNWLDPPSGGSCAGCTSNATFKSWWSAVEHPPRSV